jgi:hypothetical protein
MSIVKRTKSQITDRLWVGSYHDARECLEDPNFLVVTVAWDAPVKGHHVYGLTDPGLTDEDKKLFPLAVDKVCHLLATTDKHILVHCYSGINRSVSVCIATLMKTEGISLFLAYDKIDRVRPDIWPFQGHLESAAAYNEQVIKDFTSIDSYCPISSKE